MLLTYLPFPATDGHLRESHRVFDYAKKYKVQFLGWEDLRNVVDFDIDFYDSDHHMNYSGGRKISKYIGKYLTEQYKLTDQRKNIQYKHWYDDFCEYKKIRLEVIKKDYKSLKNTLMQLSDRNFSYAVYFPSDRLYQNKIVMKLLRNIGADVEQIYFQSPNLIIVDNKKKKVTYRTMNETANSSFGKLSVKKSKDGSVFEVNGQTILEIKNSERLEAAVIVFDNDSGKRVAAQKYQAL